MKWKAWMYQAMEQEDPSWLLECLLGPLALLAPLYGAIQTGRAQAYHHHLLPRYTLPCKVISVGNLTLGGTGKTPLVALLAKLLVTRGYRVAILSHGYRGKAKGDIQLISDGTSLLLHPPLAADEPYMLARKLPTIPVVCGKNRYQAGLYALQHFALDVIILDDGFQHLALHRNIDLLLVDNTRPLDRARLFPRGVLREPLSAIGRADGIILTKAFSPSSLPLIRLLRHYNPAAPLYRSYYTPHSLFQANDQQEWTIERLHGAPVLAFCGIAHPAAFFSLVEAWGGKLVETQAFPDHYSYRPAELETMIRTAKERGAVALLTTEKDGARLRPYLPLPFPLWELRIEAVVKEAHWFTWIEQAL